MPNEMEKVLDIVGDFLAHKTAPVGCTDIEEHDAAEFKKALPESGLLRLLEAGQAIRDMQSEIGLDIARQKWDAAIAAMKEKAHV